MLYTEDQIRNEALKELAARADGKLSTAQLIDILTKKMNPQGKDAEIADNRGDTYFSQKVRNLVSHRNDGRGLHVTGLATHDPNEEGWTITQAGRDYVTGSA